MNITKNETNEAENSLCTRKNTNGELIAEDNILNFITY
jgi:hypothetical protein